ncbi:BspA family leucine-rich repeat surface protein [Candidatus Stoquefichus sp. SB1]|uniref:BspA family leucine-rich repeat surface protein n=1 Tax=Candidatus Stoquefichus sp. SB1 TaxID=1658109 RepID=UPI00067F576E|nr:BspA family leucine-rich repeat surface protein [Candidatus Stoquefichus sp. SB1]
MKYHLKGKYRLKVNAFLVKQFKIWCSVLLVIAGSSYMLKNAYAEETTTTHWDISDTSTPNTVSADYADGTLTISGEGTMGKLYKVIDNNREKESLWNDYRFDITNVVIKENVIATDLSYMFYKLAKVTTISGLDKIDTTNVTDMSNMFYYCLKLNSIDLSKFKTVNVTNMENMFYACEGLIELDVSKFNTSRVTNMSDMFYDCQSLTELDVSQFDTSQVTNMNDMFSCCYGLTELDVSKLNTSQVTNMEGMFSYCNKLKQLDISMLKTSQVTNMQSMFRNCNDLVNLNFSGIDTSKVSTMFAMFSGCKSLTGLDVSSLNTGQVTNMSRMFEDCQSLTSLDLSCFDTSNVKTMDSMFADCQSLTSLDLSRFNTSNVTVMSYMFMDCQALTTLDVSYFDTSKVYGFNDMFNGCLSLVKIKGLAISIDDCMIDNVFTATPNLSEIQVKTKVSLDIPYIDDNHRWYDDQGNQLISDGDNAVIPVSETYVTYTLKPGISYDIIYNLYGGVLPDDAQDQFEILGEYELPMPTKNGYIFDGWYDSEDFNHAITKIEKNTTKDMTVYAKWIGKTAIKADDFKVELSSETYTGNEITYTITSSLDGVGTFQVKKLEKDGIEVSKVKEAGTYKMTFDVAEADQYKSATVTKEFKISQATNSWKDELHIENWTYGEKANVPTSQVSFGEVKYTYSSSKNGKFTENKPTDAGTWYVKAQVNETSNYTGLEEVKEFNINKAIPTVELPTNLRGIEDQLLSTVTLSKGWTWADGDIVLSVQNGGYKARLIIDDTNYDYTGVEGYNKENHYVERTLNVSIASKEAGSIQKEVKKGNNAPDIKIPITESQLANIVLTDEEKKAVEKGNDIKIVLTVDDASGQISIKDKTVVESVLGKMKIGQYLDVSLLKIIDHEESRISQTRGTIKITIEIPESLRKANREFVMIRVHDGVATILKDLDTDANTITIETDRFSTYAIAYQDKQSNIAETEDRTVIGGYIILVGLTGMLLFINRKQKRI